MFYVYILKSITTNKFYVGHTDNIERRLLEHNSGKTRFTSQQGYPWTLIYKEEFSTRIAAMQREKEIKSKKKRSYIELLVRALD